LLSFRGKRSAKIPYFEKAVLPLDGELEEAYLKGTPHSFRIKFIEDGYSGGTYRYLNFASRGRERSRFPSPPPFNGFFTARRTKGKNHRRVNGEDVHDFHGARGNLFWPVSRF
jgi:hypothetical protein